MRNILSILFVVCLYVSAPIAQPGPKIHPSVYYTYGDYSDKTRSNSISGYVPFTWNGFDYITLGYDKLSFNNPELKYRQQLFLAAGSFNFYPFYLKLGYLHIRGGLDFKQFPSEDSDFLNLYGAEVLFNIDLFYLGISFDYSNLIGFHELVIKHFGASLLWIINPKFSVELKPLYTSITDGRKLYAASLAFNYSPTKLLTLKLYGFAGERAYYYDEDLLTMFNKNETQKNLVSFRVEFNVVKELTLIGNYQYTEFQNYSISYYVGGLKFNLSL